MDNIILFLGIFTMTATAAQVSLLNTWWQRVGAMLALAVAVYWFYPFAIRQSTADLDLLINNPIAMQDLAVIIVLEAVVMVILSLFMLRDYYEPLKGAWSWILKLQYLPALTAIIMLGYWEIHLFYMGIDLPFEQTAMLYGGGTALGLLIAAYILRALMPIRVLRLELKLAMHGAQFVIAVATSVLMSRYPYRGTETETNALAFGVFVLIVIIMFALGVVLQKRHFSKKYLQ